MASPEHETIKHTDEEESYVEPRKEGSISPQENHKAKRLKKKRNRHDSERSKSNEDSSSDSDTDTKRVKSVIKVVKRDEKVVEKSKSRRGEMSLNTKTGGAYIPPAKLLLMQKDITDKSSLAFQRIAWEALKKSINGLINKVNISNMKVIVKELFSENIIRGRGILCQALMQAQSSSPTFSHVFAFLSAVINCSFPNIGLLLAKRLVMNFKRGFKRNDKVRCVSSLTFIAHLVNVEMMHEVAALEILTVLLENPTDDSVEVASSFLRECGQKLTELSPRGVNAIFDTLRHILHEADLEKRSLYTIEVLAQIRKDGFRDNPSLVEEFKASDMLNEDDQVTHMVMLDEVTDGEDILNVFKFDDKYEENEMKYNSIKASLLGGGEGDDVASRSNSSDSNSASSSDSSDSESETEKDEKDLAAPIIDNTETNLIALRRTIYLTIQSSLDFEETVHKLLRMKLKEGHEKELAHMVIDCCAQERTYEKFYGLLAQRLCVLSANYVEPFQEVFVSTYSTAHRLEIGKLRNICRLFAHLLFTDAIDWGVLCVIKLNEQDSTSSSRVFLKILMLEITEYMGLNKLLERLQDPILQQTALEGMFPKDDPANTRFAINFFTSIGLGILTEELRAHLKTNPQKKKGGLQSASLLAAAIPDDSSSSSSSSSDSDDSPSSSSSSSDDSVEMSKKRKKKLDSTQYKNSSSSSSRIMADRRESSHIRGSNKDRMDRRNIDEDRRSKRSVGGRPKSRDRSIKSTKYEKDDHRESRRDSPINQDMSDKRRRGDESKSSKQSFDDRNSSSKRQSPERKRNRKDDRRRSYSPDRRGNGGEQKRRPLSPMNRERNSRKTNRAGR